MVDFIPFSTEQREIVFWIISSALCLTMELLTARLIVFWFACSALGASYLADLGYSLETQLFFFVAIPIPLTIVSQFIIRAIYEAAPADVSTKDLIGQEAYVIDTINPKTKKGKIKIGDREFSAKSKKVIKKAQRVKIKRFDGLRAIVKKA